VIAAVAVWFFGIETRGRTLTEIDDALTAPVGTRMEAETAAR
jgi:hypothetical protein